MSTKFTLDGIDWKKILIGAGVAATGAALTYLTDVVSGLKPGAYTPLIVAGWSIIANIIRKWIEGIETPTAEEFLEHTEPTDPV